MSEITKDRRRTYGSGSIFQRADGRWVGRAEAGWTPTGSRRRVSVVASTEAEAKRRLRDRMRDLDRGVTTASRLTVKAWADQWLAAKVDRVRPKTFTADRAAVRLHIVPTIGHRRLDQIGAQDIRAVSAAVTAAGHSAATAHRVHVVLHGLLVDAEREGHTVPRAATLARPPSRGKGDRQALELADALAVLKVAAGDDDGSRWVAGLLQGMRQGECLGLTWDLVDTSAGWVDVSWQLQGVPSVHGCGDPPTCGHKRGGFCPKRRRRIPAGFEMRELDGWLALTRPKTAAGQRIIPLVPWMRDSLDAWRLKAPKSAHGLVWPAADGRPCLAESDRAAWVDLQARANVTGPGRPYAVHEMRHTTATLLAEAGVDPSVIMAILGHSTVATQAVYKTVRLDATAAALGEVAARLSLGGTYGT